jgi:hypothetical protein
MKLILALNFLFLFQGAFSQKANRHFRRNELNIYFQAINQYLHFSEQESVITDTLFLESGYEITDSILSECQHTKLVKLDKDQLTNLLKERKSLNLYRIMPLATKAGKFRVALIPFGCGYNQAKGKYEFLYGGEYIAVFKFDGKRFVFQKIEEHGI